MSQPLLTTERLILRPFTLPDAPVVQRLAGDFAIADTTFNIPHPYEDGMAEAWIASHPALYDTGEMAAFAIVLRQDSELIGCIGLTLALQFFRAEMGYWIGLPYWNRGYCTEAAAAVVAFAFSGLGLHKVSAHHLVRNPASGRVLRKIGMEQEGMLRDHTIKWSCFEDISVYGLLAPDWRTIIIRAGRPEAGPSDNG